MDNTSEVILNQEQYDQILSVLNEHTQILETQSIALQNSLSYIDQIYRTGIIYGSIVLAVFILIIFYKLITCFGR